MTRDQETVGRWFPPFQRTLESLLWADGLKKEMAARYSMNTVTVTPPSHACPKAVALQGEDRDPPQQCALRHENGASFWRHVALFLNTMQCALPLRCRKSGDEIKSINEVQTVLGQWAGLCFCWRSKKDSNFK